MKSNISAIALSGGYGTRIRPLTYFKPKPLIKIGKHPVLHYVLVGLYEYGIKDIMVNIHYKKKQMLKFLGDLHPALYEKKLLGTAGTVKKLSPFMSDDFFVVNGDTITEVDFKKMYEYHKKNGYKATVFWDAKKNCCGGIYLFNKEYIEHFGYTGMIDDVLKEHKFYKYISNEFWLDMGSHAKLKEARKRYA